MLEIKPTFDSTAEAVLAFKTCCGLRAPDQNLEVIVRNHGAEPVTLRCLFELEGEGETVRVETVLPGGEVVVPPGDVRSFYCTLEEEVWRGARRLVMCEPSGARHAVALEHSAACDPASEPAIFS